MNAAREQVVILFQCRFLNPIGNCISCGWRDFKLHRLRSLLLHDDGPGAYTVAVANISDSELYKVTCSQLAVQAEVEHCKFTYSVTKLKPDADCPDVLEF